MRKTALSVADQTLKRLEDSGNLSAALDVQFEVANVLTIGASSYWLAAKKTIFEIADQLETRGQKLAPLKRAETWTRVGDWMILGQERKAAKNAYRNAWIDYHKDGQDSAVVFAEPRLLCTTRMLPKDLAKEIDSTKSELTFGYQITVEPNGRASQVKVIESDYGNRYMGALKFMARQLRFRPAMVDGELIDTPDYQYHHRLFQESP